MKSVPCSPESPDHTTSSRGCSTALRKVEEDQRRERDEVRQVQSPRLGGMDGDDEGEYQSYPLHDFLSLGLFLFSALATVRAQHPSLTAGFQ